MVAASLGALLGATGSFSLGVNDVFRLVDPETYRSQAPAHLPILVIKTAGTLAVPVGLSRDLGQAAA